jgi:cation diffusion facilitator CzcD-associated flavoprotein CzcO
MSSEHYDVVIVGAGFSGLGVAIALQKRRLRRRPHRRRCGPGAGGVWHWNTYPGVAVDIPSFSYQFSFAQRTDWSRSYAKGAELKGYAEYLVDQFGLADSSASAPGWPRRRSTSRRTCGTSHLDGDLTAKYLIHAGGPLSQPKYPDIDGLDCFDGIVMHTARWDHDVDLRGKRVGIIGTGASAVQIIPEIAPAGQRPDRVPADPDLVPAEAGFPAGRTGVPSV